MSEIKAILSAIEDHKAKYDETVKELLSNKQFLSRIVKRFVPEFSSYSLEDLRINDKITATDDVLRLL